MTHLIRPPTLLLRSMRTRGKNLQCLSSLQPQQHEGRRHLSLVDTYTDIVNSSAVQNTAQAIGQIHDVTGPAS